MPGRDYTHAFAILDQSLRPGSYFKPATGLSEEPSLDFEGFPERSDTGFRESTPKLNGSLLSPPPAINALESAFPPTPPLSGSNHLQSTAPAKSEDFVAQDSHDSGITTPTNPQSLPTPDNTPPRLLAHLAPQSSGNIPAPSPYTASFTTAQENQSSPDEFDLDKSPDPREQENLENGDGHASDRHVELHGLGMGGLADGGRTIPSLRHRGDISDLSVLDKVANNQHSEANGEYLDKWDSEKMRNVTLRHSKKHRISPLRSAQSPRSTARPQTPTNVRDDRDDHELLSPTSEGSSNIFDLDLKRLSGTSGSSTIVEAMVIDRTPPPRKRKLRHVSKTESLRDESSPQIGHDSSTSEDLPSHRSGSLKPFLQSQERSVLGGQRSLRRRDASLPLRPLTAPADNDYGESFNQSNDKRRVVSDPLQISPLSIEDMTPPPPSASPASLTAEDFHDAASIASRDGTSFGPANGGGNSQYEASPPMPVPGSFPASSTPDLSTLSSSSTENAHRHSFAQSFGVSEISSRHLHAASPRSVKTDATENFEISEAAAVQFSSHTNNSLLVINNSSSHDNVDRQPVTVSTSQAQSNDRGTFITLEPATPEQPQPEIIAVDSPLQNPRAAPEPPTFAIIPPTPARELDDQRDDSSAPTVTRDNSLLRRARRYSESFIQPFTGTFRRTRRTTSKRRSQSASRVEQEDGERLHPNWRPKGYESDYDSDEGEDDRYFPPGDGAGATPVEQGSPPEKWRRMNSLRGFLIGNTLGLQRGPTNKQRHIVYLPANKRRTQTPRSSTTSATPITVRDSVKRSGSGKRIKRHRGGRTIFRGWREKMFEQRWVKGQRLREEKAAKLKSNIRWPSNSVDEQNAIHRAVLDSREKGEIPTQSRFWKSNSQ